MSGANGDNLDCLVGSLRDDLSKAVKRNIDLRIQASGAKMMMEAMKNCQNCRHVENTVGYCALCTRATVHKTVDEDRMSDRWELMDTANDQAQPPKVG